MKISLSINPEFEVKKITNFLKKTLKEQKIDRIVLGLSGGIDSATALYLLKQVLPSKNIYVVLMDYRPRKKLDIDLKGINEVNVSIKKIVDQFEKNVLKAKISDFESMTWGPFGVKSTKNHDIELLNKVRIGNIMARTRMIILFDLAKQLNALVCGTENKSERLLGYFTRFGDAASDLEPISHLYKTQIYQLAKYLKVPDEIIDQKPTAGLWDGQTDESDFGFTYQEADQVLHLYTGKKKSVKEIKKLGFKNAEKIIKRSLDNQFKLKTPYSIYSKE